MGFSHVQALGRVLLLGLTGLTYAPHTPHRKVQRAKRRELGLAKADRESIVSNVDTIDYLDLKEVDGSFVQSIRTTTVQKLQAERTKTAKSAGPGSIRLFASHDTTSSAVPPADLMKNALLSAFQTWSKIKPTRVTRRKSPKHLYLWSISDASKVLHEEESTELAAVLQNLHHGDVVVDFSGVTDRQLKALEESFKNYFGAVLAETTQAAIIDTRKILSTHEAVIRLLVSDPVVTITPPAQSAGAGVKGLEQLAAERRGALAKDWATAADVSRQLGSTAENASQLATKWRREGKLLGVYLPVPTANWRFPNWQFQPDGNPVEFLEEILKVLHEKGPFLDSSRRTTGWGEVEWFLTMHALLDGEAPALMLATDPERVLRAAQVEFEEEP